MNRPALLAILAVAIGLAVFGLVGSETTREPSGGPAQRPDHVRVAGVMVSGPILGGSAEAPQLAFSGPSARTRLALELAWPEGGLIGLRSADSVVMEFRDDRGTNLLTQGSRGAAVEEAPQVAADGRGLVFVLRSDAQPDPRATRLVARGFAEITVGDELVKHESEPLEIAVDALVRAGPFRLRVAELGPGEASMGSRIRFTSQTDLTAVVRLALIDDEGRAHDLAQLASSDAGGVWERTLTFPSAVTHGRVIVEAWTDPRIEAVPFDVSTGIGLR